MQQYYNVDLERETVQYIGRFKDWHEANEVLETGVDHGFAWLLDRTALEELLAEGCKTLEDSDGTDHQIQSD